MTLRLWHRLFLAIALLSIAALALFAALQARGFQQGFLGYVNRLERDRIEAASGGLAEAYAAHGSWDFLRGDTPRMLALLQLPAPGNGARVDEAFEPPPSPPEADAAPAPGPRPRDGLHPFPPRMGDGRGPGRRPPPPWARPPRPQEATDAHGPKPPPSPPPPPRDGAPSDRPPPARAPLGTNLRPRLLLLDADGRPVAGNPRVANGVARIDGATTGRAAAEPAQIEPATVEIRSGDRIVGRLLLAPLPKLDSDLDLAFAREQRRQMLLSALVALLGALALAWALSRWLLRPVRALAAGTQSLAAGDYAARIDIDRNDELGALARDFNALAAALEQNRDARRQWGADIAHELRTPISVLGGEIQALQDGVRQVDAARLASLQAECGRLRDLVEDLYQLSISDAGALNYRFAPMDLADLVREAVRAQAGVMQDAGLALVADAVRAPCPLARGDRARLRQLIDNLLANATRYTDRPGRVILSLDRDAQRAHLRIDDTAPGVPDAALPRLFERLYRVESSRDRRFGGAGLGLAICRNIVEAHGGSIVAAHSPEGGLRIDIELPTQ